MKIKRFNQLNEGKGRIDIKGNHVHTGSTGLPQFWSTSPDYKKEDSKKNQKVGIDPESFIAPPGNDYSYLLDTEDHIDQNDVKKLVEPHIKKFNDFGFTPDTE